MIVLIGDKTHNMAKFAADELRRIAKTFVRRGIYAVKKDGMLELRNDLFSDKGEMKAAIKEWNTKGFVVFWNWG